MKEGELKYNVKFSHLIFKIEMRSSATLTGIQWNLVGGSSPSICILGGYIESFVWTELNLYEKIICSVSLVILTTVAGVEETAPKVILIVRCF